MRYLIPLAGFSHLKNEQIRKENIFHLDLESGDHDYFDSDVVIMMEMLQHISTMLWYALIMQTTGWFNDEVNFCCNIIDQNPEICDGDDEEHKEIEDDDCDDDDDDDDAKWAHFCKTQQSER